MDKNNTSDIGTTELAVGGVAFTVAFLLLSDDSDGSGGGVVPTIQRVVPDVPVVEQVTNPSGNNSGGGNRDSGNDGTGMFDQTLTDGENPFTGTDVSGSGGGRDFQDSVNEAFSDFV